MGKLIFPISPCKSITSLFNGLKIFSNQWCEPEKIHSMQNRKLQNLVHTAYRNVKYYRRLFDKYGLSPSSVRTIEDLPRIPVTTKTDFQKCSGDEILNPSFSQKTLVSEHSSGSMGQPFRVYYDPDYRLIRNMLFLRGLTAAGYRIGEKIQLVTDPGKKDKSILRWHYSSILDTPENLLAELNRRKPDLLYGCKTSLIRLAEYIRDTRSETHFPKRVVSTAELLTQESRSLLEQVFSAKVYDFYGSTEMGLVGWECGIEEGYHLSADSVILEFEPLPGNPGLSKMIMTNLDLKAMPLIRYDTGDLGMSFSNRPCRCGRLLPRLQKVVGRQNDCIKMKGGIMISPYRVTSALEKIPNIIKYKVIQTDWEDFTVKVRTMEHDTSETSHLVRNTMYSILGNSIRVNMDFNLPVESQDGRKFRVVESLVMRN